MRLRYRHVQQPVPAISNNPHDAVAAFYMRAVDAGSYNGTEFLAFSNRDESRPLNGAVYFAQTGRTQTLASFATEQAMFGSDIGPNDFLTYSGPLPAQRWRYLGSSFMLLPLYRHDQIDPAAHKARQHAYWHVDFGGQGGCFPKVQWQLRPTLILQATALDPAAVVTRRVFYRANLCARPMEDLSRRATTVEVCYPRLRPSRFSYGCEPRCWSAHSERSVDH